MCNATTINNQVYPCWVRGGPDSIKDKTRRYFEHFPSIAKEMNPILLTKEFLRQFPENDVRSEFSLREHVQAAIDWISVAQDVTGNDGVSLRYSLLEGWAPPYPETTGYIIPTFLKYGWLAQSDEYEFRAIRMANWELSIQNDDGSFMGGPLGARLGKLAFDTGQIIFGLVEAYRKTNDETYIRAAMKAGDWLARAQEDDGSWRKFGYRGLAHTYYGRVAWGLAELARTTNEKRYEIAARKNIEWVLTMQHANGWFDNAAFTAKDIAFPYTHTIAYTIRGILETGCHIDDEIYIDAAIKSSDALLRIMNPDGFFWATYGSEWQRGSDFSCLTGNAQISIIFWRLYKITGEAKYLHAGKLLNRYLRSKQNMQIKDKRIWGAIAGSYPIWGSYERFAFPNWAAKFFIDALILEEETE